jgi:hypothetical protein
MPTRAKIKKVEGNIYKLNKKRTVSLLLTPVLYFGFMFLLFYLNDTSFREISSFELLVIVLVLLPFLAPFFYLFFNHLKLAKHSILVIKEKEITFICKKSINSFNFSEIIEIRQYCTYRLPWRDIVRWDLITKNGRYIISSLIISESEFDKYFFNKIEKLIMFMPTI